MIAPLGEQRQAVAELARDGRRPGAERDHGLRRRDRPGRRIHGPTRARLPQGTGVADGDRSAQLPEQPGIGLDERTRIADAPRGSPAQPARGANAEGRLRLGQTVGIELEVFHAIVARITVGLGKSLVTLRFGAEHQGPAVLVDEALGSRRADELGVLADAVGNQRGIVGNDPAIAGRRGIPPVLCELGGVTGERRERVTGIEPAMPRDAQQRREIAREGARPHALALDQPGIAERRFAARFAPVDQHHVAAAALQMDGDADADNSSTEYNYVRQFNPRHGEHATGQFPPVLAPGAAIARSGGAVDAVSPKVPRPFLHGRAWLASRNG